MESYLESICRDVITKYFLILNSNEKDKLSDIWIENGVLFINNEIKDISFLKKLPSFITFNISNIKLLSFDSKISVFKVEWKMILPDSIGIHTSYITLILYGDLWKIINQTDIGIEISEQ